MAHEVIGVAVLICVKIYGLLENEAASMAFLCLFKAEIVNLEPGAIGI